MEIPVFVETDLFSFQFTLRTEGLQFIGVQPGSIDITSECIAIHDEAITMSWVNVEVSRSFNLEASSRPPSVETESLFVLTFIAKTDGSLSEILQITSDITEAEAYRPLADDVELLDVQLIFEKTDVLKPVEFVLYQNEPNPFEDQTAIGFNLPSGMSASLTVYDLHGREVFQIDGNYPQGRNEIVLMGKELKVAGAYFYRLNAGDFIASKKLILTRQ